MRYMVQEVVGEYGITLDDGQRVYDLIHPELVAGQPVELNFEGVEVFASPFFNGAFGQLLKDLSREDINRLLKITNLIPEGSHVLHRVIENSKRYYSDARLRSAQDEVLSELGKEL